jgi:hypothetical protein
LARTSDVQLHIGESGGDGCEIPGSCCGCPGMTEAIAIVEAKLSSSWVLRRISLVARFGSTEGVEIPLVIQGIAEPRSGHFRFRGTAAHLP